jgi:tetratricopeptide (TPR) repeat protein
MSSSKKKKVLMPNFGYNITILILIGIMLTLWFRGNIQIVPQSNLNQEVSKKEPTPAPPSVDKNETKTEKNTEVPKENSPAHKASKTTPTPPDPAPTKPSEELPSSSEPETPKEPIITNDNFTVSEQDQEILEIIEIGVALRKKGETLESLKKLRKAKEISPQNPRAMWELHLTYVSMSLQQKAENELTKIMDLGEDRGGEYYQIIKLKKNSDDGSETKKKSAGFTFGLMRANTKPQEIKGESVNVKMEIISSINEPIDPKDISLVVDFYDLVNGSKVERTRADPPSATWITKPINWQTSNIEIVNWNYYMPQLSQEDIKNFGKRSYHGFVARLYYKDLIQDIYAEPRILLEPKKLGVESFIEGSLFPN